MDLNELASDLFGSKRAESSTQPSTVSVMYGIATSDSADGLVSVWLSDNALSPTDAQAQWETVDSYDADAYEGMDESTSIEIPTEVTCLKDDVVRVQLTGAGAAKNPTVVGVVGRGDEQNQRLGSIEADYIKATELEADVAQIGFLKADSAVITNLQADTAKVHNLTADQLTAATAFIADLNAASITAQTLTADVAKVHNLTADQISAAAAYIADLKADSIEATNISAMYGDFDTVKANAAKVSSLTAQQLTAAVGYINDLTSASVTAQNLAADHATIGSLDTNYARVDLVNANVAWLQNGLIKDASISDAKIIGVSANKLTAGTIDAAEINVMNLRADNLKVSRVNGQPVLGGYSLVDPSGSGYASKNPKTQGWYELTANGYVLTDDTTVVSGKAYYTTSTSVELYDQDYIDGLAEDLSDRIDGAIETFTSSAVPTPNNYPASDWTTDDIRATHVGDVCYVLNEDSDNNGWCYRYAYNTTTHQYGWVLIKDSDVTAALSRLLTVEGVIGDVSKFDEDIATFLTDENGEFSRLQTRTTSLETSMGDKVDSSTFNSVSQTVNANVARIDTLTATTSTLANPNLSPFYSNEFYDGDYWSSANSPYSSELGKCFTQLEDGWAHVDFDNSERTSNAYHNIYVKQPIDHIKPDTTYTFVYEVRNLSIVGDGALVLYGQDSQASDQMASHSASITITEDGVYRMTFTSRSSFTDAMVRPVRVCLRIGASTNAQLDVRASLYEGEYTGPYKPYINAYTVTTISNTVNEVKQTATSNSTTISQLTQTLGTNADGTTKTDDIVHRTTKVEQDLDGITTTVGRIDSEMETVSNPNLAPYFSMPYDDLYDATGNPDGYWERNDTSTLFTTHDMQVEHGGSGGWLHMAGNATSGNPFMRFEPMPITTLKPSTKYTFVIDIDTIDIASSITKVDLVIASGTLNTDVIDPFSGRVRDDTIKGKTGTFYLTGTTRDDISNSTALSRSYLQIYGSGTFDIYLRISLFEGEYKGQYKPYVDQMLSTRVKAAETSITQNAEAIELRATKTEAYQVAQPNLSPYYSSVPYASSNTYWKGITTASPYVFTDMGDGWMRVQCTNSGSSTSRRDWYPIPCPSIEPGKPYTWLAEIRNNNSDRVSSGSDFYLVQTNNCQFWGQQAIKTLNEPQTGVSSGAAISINLGTLSTSGIMRKVQNAEMGEHWTSGDAANVIGLACWTFRCAANSSIDYEVRLSVYEGEYTGPYKPYSGNQLYASQAELKVTNSEVSSKVSTTDYNGSTIASLINQSADSVVIEANHIQLNGTTVFNSIKSTLDSNYDAKGAASAVQTNLDNLQVGGRNLLLGTSDSWSEWVTPTANTNNWTKYWYISKNDELLDWATAGQSVTFSMDIEFSGVTKSSSGTFKVYSQDCFKSVSNGGMDGSNNVDWNIGAAATALELLAPPADGIYTFTKTISFAATHTTRYALLFSIRADYWASGQYRIRRVKYELGNKATDWTPAPEDQTAYVDESVSSVQIGGRNLVLGTADWSKWLSSSGATISGDEITYSANDTNNRLVGVAVVPGDTYTISMDIRADSAYTYGTSGNTFLLLDYGTSGEYERVGYAWAFYGTSLTTEWQRVAETFTVPTTDTLAKLYVSFRNTGGSNQPTYHVRHLKVERGNKATDWTPAPEDQVESTYATCSTAAGTAAKVVTTSGMFDLHNGVTITVKFTTANTAAEPTINVNGTGAYQIWNNNAKAASANPVLWGANATLSFIFDGSHWVLAEKAPSYSVSCNTAAATQNKTASVTGALVVNGTTVAVLFQTANTYESAAVRFALSSTGNTNIYLDRAVTSATHTFTWSANTVITLVRNGAGWYVSDGRAKDSVSVSQRIYYRSTSSTKPDAPSAWVEEATENVYDAWTTKVPPLAESTAEGQTKYLYLWTCEQRKAMSGSFVGCTDVQLDENTTVIDGGKIITHSIAAESIQANSLTLGQISTTTQTDILNSKVQVGGRNLLRKTGALAASDLNLARATVTEDGVIALTPTTSAAYASFKVHYLDFDEYGSGTYTVSFDAKLSDATTTYTASNVLAYLGFQDPARVDSAILNSTYDRYTPSRTLSSELTNEWQRFETVVIVPDDLTSGKAAALSSGYMMVVELGASGSKKPILIRHVKLEKGTKATDWTPAPEDQESLITSSFGSLSESFAGLDEIVTGEDGLQAYRVESAKKIGDLETYADQLKELIPALQETVSWLSFTPDTGLIIGDSADSSGNFFYTQQTGSSMAFNQQSGGNTETLMELSATNGIEGPKVTSPLLVLGDYSIEEANGMFMINYIGS